MKCQTCGYETDSDMGFKRHMTRSHGGYSVEQLKSVGITPNRQDIARALAGNTSASEVTKQAPEGEPKPGDSGQITRTRRPKTQAEDPEVLKAKEQIIRLRCNRMACLPYTLLANMLGEPDIKLNEEEAAMLTESFVTLAKAYGWEGASKLLLWGDACVCTTAIFMEPKRKEAILKGVGMIGQPEEAKEEAQAGEVAHE